MKLSSVLAVASTIFFTLVQPVFADTFECVEGEDYKTSVSDTAQISSFYGYPGDTVEMALIWKTDSTIIGFESIIRYPGEALTPVMYPESALYAGRTPIDVSLAGRGTANDGDGSMNIRLRSLSYHLNDSNLILVNWFIPLSGEGSIPGGGGEIVRVRFVVKDNAPQGVFHPIAIEHWPVVWLADSEYVQLSCKVALTGQEWRSDSGVQLLVAVVPVLVAGTFESECCETPGDYNRDRKFNISDINEMVNWLFLGGEPTRCAREADNNGDKKLNIGDVVYGIANLFAGGLDPYCRFTHD